VIHIFAASNASGEEWVAGYLYPSAAICFLTASVHG
jgi:hypothetical protein